MTHAPVRFGVLGATSTVARLAVVPALRAEPSCALVATASVSRPERLDDPGGDARHYARYEDLLADPGVDAVYLPLPNALHRPWTEAAASAGKHVLCEKPLAGSTADARAMTAACERAGVLLAEAYMTPYHPREDALWRLLDTRRLGDLLHVRAAFTFPHNDPDDHRWRQDMQGGALRDVGPYVLHPLVALGRLLGVPVQVRSALQVRGGDGVDATTSAMLSLGDGCTATILCSFTAARGSTVRADRHAGDRHGGSGIHPERRRPRLHAAHPDGRSRPGTHRRR